MKNPLVSVVILTWNRKDDLIETITELRKSSYASIEVIVVDNGSEDGTPAVIKERFPDVVFVRLEKNTGIAGYNIGMKKARGDYVVLLDSDSFPERNAIERMLKIFESDNKIGAVAFDVHNTVVSGQWSVIQEALIYKRQEILMDTMAQGLG